MVAAGRTQGRVPPLPEEASGMLVLGLPSGGWFGKVHLEDYTVSQTDFIIFFS